MSQVGVNAAGATHAPSYRFETSWIFSPSVLAAIRAILSLYAFVTLFTIFGYNGAHGLSEESEHSFSYFTHLTYWGLAFYFLFAALHTSIYALTGKSTLARWPRVLQTAHGVFYSTITVYPWIVTSESDPAPCDSVLTSCSCLLGSPLLPI
jgi:hypothetical protein